MKIITGWTRGGLGYIGELLSSAGHAVVFSDATSIDRTWKTNREEMGRYVIAPFLSPFIPESVDKDVVFVLRDPMRVLNSLQFLGLLSEERSTTLYTLLVRSFPGLMKRYRGKPVQLAVAYLYAWYAAAARRPATQYVRVEDSPEIVLAAITGKSKGKARFVARDINCSNCHQTLIPSMLPEESGRLMKYLLRTTGYLDKFWSPRGGHAHFINPDWHC